MRVERFVDLHLIKIDRYPINKKTLDLVDFIRSGGVVKAIRVAREPNGMFKIKDGRHRFTAYKLLGENKILCRFYDKMLKNT